MVYGQFTQLQTCVGSSNHILRDLFFHRPLRIVYIRKPLNNGCCYRWCNPANFLQNDYHINKFIIREKGSLTSCSCTKRKGFSTNVELSFLQCAAFFWKPAPGNQLGTYTKMGNKSTQKAPGTEASLAPSITSPASEI
jgi:hypothetical protein